MKVIKKYVKKLLRFAKDNYLITAFCLIIFMVGVIVVFKMATAKDNFVYAKVKVSQGYWWASTLRPSLWLVQSLQKGDAEVNLSGNPLATIQEVNYYPVANYNGYMDQFDVYLTIRLKVNKNKKTGKYTFKRSTLSVGSPVDFDLKNVQISATVIALSEKPFQDTYVDKTITLTKKFVNPSEYELITIGDTYYNGNQQVLEVLDVTAEDAYAIYDASGNNYPINTERPVNVTLTVKMRLQQKDNSLLFGEEIIIKNGKRVNLLTSGYLLDQYLISSVE